MHAGTDPVSSISLIDRTRAEIDVAQGAILGDLLAVSPKVCADRVVSVGNVRHRGEEGGDENRNGH